MPFLPVKEQLELLTCGIVDLHTHAELEKKLTESYQKNRPLVIKAGFDPTMPDLHLGHAVLLNKMRQFQLLGHQVLFLIGNFTACIGDPTGRNEQRPALTQEQVTLAAQTYTRQAFKILDAEKTHVVYNADWLNTLTPQDFIRLTSHYTVARMIERDDFNKRFHEGRAISLHEFLYPLLQGYDSVAIRADVELGGQDQLFNLLVGRDLMRSYQLIPQVVLTMPLLLGLDARLVDGVLQGDKMSKSKNNYVAFEDSPSQMFGKIMSICDDLMWNWYPLLSSTHITTIESLKLQVATGAIHPKKLKESFAHEIVSLFYGKSAAQDALDEFLRVFSKQGVPDDVSVLKIDGSQSFFDAIFSSGLFASKSELRRLFEQQAISVMGQKIIDSKAEVPIGEHVVKIGKHKFLKIIR